MSVTGTSAFPLTTLFTPNVECFSYSDTIPNTAIPTGTLTDFTLGNGNVSDCMPPGWHPNSFFSPGICPYGYTVATSSFDHAMSENIAHCCPTTKTSGSHTTGICTTSLTVPQPATRPDGVSVQVTATGINAYDVSVKWRSNDFPKSFSDTPKETEEKSTRTKAIIGAAAAIGFLLATTIIVTLSSLCRRRTRASKTNQNTKKPGLWAYMTLDSWSPETLAICFSIACFVAIFYTLHVYNNKPQPEFPHGITLNTIISILATGSKSSLLFLVGECIGQLRWTSLRNTLKPRPLSHVQAYDSASRGPWGSLMIFKYDKFRSPVMMIGALITILALSFDPFIQQIIKYEDRQIPRHSDKARIKQSRDFASVLFPVNTSIFISTADDAEYTTDFLKTMAIADWSDKTALDPTCPSGQCTWPRFKSIEFCNTCRDITKNSTLVGCEVISPDHANGTQNTIQTSCRISLPEGEMKGNAGIWYEKLFDGDHAHQLVAPTQIVGQVIGDYENTNDGTWKDAIYLGVTKPLFVAAHAEFEILQPTTHGSDITVSELAKAFKLKKVTECAISFCSRTYDIAVSEGLPSTKVVEEDMGIPYWLGDPGLSETCWKPSPEAESNDTEKAHAGTLEVGGQKIADSTMLGFCYIAFTTAFEYLQLSGNSKEVYESLDAGGGSSWGWLGLDPSGADDSFKTAAYRKVLADGLEPTMRNVASTLSSYARQISNSTVLGTAFTTESYVNVRWVYLTLPAALIVFGIALLGLTAFISSHGKSNLWKTSVLPFLYHGLEDVPTTEDDRLESVSKMEKVADNMKVNLGSSATDSRLLIRRAVDSEMPNKKHREQSISDLTVNATSIGEDDSMLRRSR
ncbi:hypothetical protein N7456_010872 [Penicillium angulare]|uniref:Uncharacterized protein n=1 Tax=Penicillium angulare TaxID=116970 RepID=A0A9W9JZN7_9EURO|nr:hypothetical protein N7456_010872 [Penicillium angulare]